MTVVMTRETDGRPHARSTRCLATLYARIALGAAFLSAVASRFGLWDRTLDMAHFRRFIEYTAQVNGFLPVTLSPVLAVAATICETALGILLLAGLYPKVVARAAAGLLAMFALAMALSQGLKSPLDYSVFSASAAALLLAECGSEREEV